MKNVSNLWSLPNNAAAAAGRSDNEDQEYTVVMVDVKTLQTKTINDQFTIFVQ